MSYGIEINGSQFPVLHASRRGNNQHAKSQRSNSVLPTYHFTSRHNQLEVLIQRYSSFICSPFPQRGIALVLHDLGVFRITQSCGDG
jgi:hypothetical protein